MPEERLDHSALVLAFKRACADPSWPVPAYGSDQAAGLDLAACVDGPTVIPAGRIRLIPSGWAVAIPEGYEGQVRPRSGVALKKGLTLINSPGTIDSDYRGEIGLAMINLGAEDQIVERGDRLAQLVISRIWRPALEVREALEDTARGGGGFGSTGIGGAPGTSGTLGASGPGKPSKKGA